jgi:hypothetical protein
MARSSPALVAAVLLGALPARPVSALIGDVPTIRDVAVVRSDRLSPEAKAFALIGETPTHGPQLILRSIRRQDGARAVPDQVVTLPSGIVPVDVLFSTVFQPDSILVLDQDLRVLRFGVAFDAFGTAKLIGDVPAVLGPFGNPAVVGAGTALAEAPGVLGPMVDSFLGIGTSSGALLIASGVVDTADYLVDLGKGPITGLATVPQVGAFVFVAGHNGRAVGVNPGGPTPPSIVFDLADPRPDPFFDIGAVFEPNDEPLKTPAPVAFVAANGTPNVAVLQIPAGPTVGGSLKVGIIIVGGCPIARVGLGSLVTVEATGRAVLYDAGFTLAGGPGGTTVTLAGAAVDLDPDVLNLRSRGKHVRAKIEVEDGHAADIDPGSPTLALSCDAGEGVPATGPAAEPGDDDADGQVDLGVTFDRAAVQALLRGLPEGPVTPAVRWTYRDGSTGCGVASLRIKR